MTGPHPAVADVRRAVRHDLAGLGPGALVLVACSGGPDSLALADAVAWEAPRAGLRAGAVVVDHGLQAGSAQVAEEAAAVCRGLGLDPVVVRRVQVGAGDGPEAAARDARYAALTAVAAELDAGAVLLGHTRDDQAETVLLRLARGSGARSLAGMPARRGLLRDDADALDAWATTAHAAAVGPRGLEVGRLADLPPAVRRRVLHRAVLAAGAPPGAVTAVHLAALDALVADWRGQGPVALPGRLAGTRACGTITIARGTRAPTDQPDDPT